MTDTRDETTTDALTDETIAAIVRLIEPTWTVRRARAATPGAHLVHHLDVETPAGTRECVCKATPPDRDPTCGDEARLLAILDAHTSLPVPAVLGVVDDHPEWPTPLFVASTLPGANHARTEMAEFSAGAVERLARSTGRQLATLHDLDAVDAYGFVGIECRADLDGGRPPADLDQITVRDPTDDWRAYLDDEVRRLTDTLGETRFADLVPAVRPALHSGVQELTGPFEPVLARIDQSLDNLIVDPGTTAVTGWLDWEFCVAATPAYDLAFVEHSLAGGHWAFLPEVPDHRETIRTALRAGYREAGPDRVPAWARENGACYALLAETHAMCNFEGWFAELDVVDAGDEDLDAAADALRERVRRLLESVR